MYYSTKDVACYTETSLWPYYPILCQSPVMSVDHSVRDFTAHSLWNVLYQLYRKHVQ